MATSLDRLPVEIIQAIVVELKALDRKSLQALTGTNRVLQDIALPYLFGDVTLHLKGRTTSSAYRAASLRIHDLINWNKSRLRRGCLSYVRHLRVWGFTSVMSRNDDYYRDWYDDVDEFETKFAAGMVQLVKLLNRLVSFRWCTVTYLPTKVIKALATINTLKHFHAECDPQIAGCASGFTDFSGSVIEQEFGDGFYMNIVGFDPLELQVHGGLESLHCMSICDEIQLDRWGLVAGMNKRLKSLWVQLSGNYSCHKPPGDENLEYKSDLFFAALRKCPPAAGDTSQLKKLAELRLAGIGAQDTSAIYFMVRGIDISQLEILQLYFCRLFGYHLNKVLRPREQTNPEHPQGGLPQGVRQIKQSQDSPSHSVRQINASFRNLKELSVREDCDMNYMDELLRTISRTQLTALENGVGCRLQVLNISSWYIRGGWIENLSEPDEGTPALPIEGLRSLGGRGGLRELTVDVRERGPYPGLSTFGNELSSFFESCCDLERLALPVNYENGGWNSYQQHFLDSVATLRKLRELNILNCRLEPKFNGLDHQSFKKAALEDFCKIIQAFHAEAPDSDEFAPMPIKYLGMRAVWRSGPHRDYVFLQVADQRQISPLGRVAARNQGWKVGIHTADGDYYIRVIEKEQIPDNPEMRHFFALGNAGFGHDEAVPYWVNRLHHDDWDSCPSW
ncbi:hypothetical protein FGG08_000571 [Glutinoglossum americanum]|uniref:Uncharacterized protein n=1 Tax=Glutinoglossum americanum TaxID=1670608 RepID=A0A9P8IG57_9PEZI|nr:hypothetical protein FGG08_000571 [Glutinoglossum americanum]